MVDLAFTAGLPRHLAPAQRRHGRHRRPRAELLLDLMSRAVRPFRDAGDRAPAAAVLGALFVFFAAVLIGASQ